VTTTAAAITEEMHVDAIIVAATRRIWPAFRQARPFAKAGLPLAAEAWQNAAISPS
jgi:hypothetical protein